MQTSSDKSRNPFCWYQSNGKWLFISIKYPPIKEMLKSLLVPEEGFRGRVKPLSGSPSIHPQCQFYHPRWINWESDSSKKSRKIKEKKISGVSRSWHCQAWLITADMIGGLVLGTGETGKEATAHSPVLSASLLFGWITKCPHWRPWILMSSIHHPNKEQ